MTPVKITIHATGTGPCALTGKESDGLTITFEDGSVQQQHLSWKAFKQILCLKTNQRIAAAKPVAVLPPSIPPSAPVAAPK